MGNCFVTAPSNYRVSLKRNKNRTSFKQYREKLHKELGLVQTGRGDTPPPALMGDEDEEHQIDASRERLFRTSGGKATLLPPEAGEEESLRPRVAAASSGGGSEVKLLKQPQVERLERPLNPYEEKRRHAEQFAGVGKAAPRSPVAPKASDRVGSSSLQPYNEKETERERLQHFMSSMSRIGEILSNDTTKHDRRGFFHSLYTGIL